MMKPTKRPIPKNAATAGLTSETRRLVVRRVGSADPLLASS
jgi:hypothetical protein